MGIAKAEAAKVIPALRFYGFDDSWVIDSLGNRIDFLSGYAFNSQEMRSEPDRFQLLKMSNIYNSSLDLDRNPTYWGELDNKISRYILAMGDVVLTLTGTVGKRDYGYSVSIPYGNKFLLNQRLVRLRGVEGKSSSGFVSALVKTEGFLDLFFNISKGGTGNQSNVGVVELKSLQLHFPSIEEQQKIASFLSAVDEKIRQLNRKKELFEQYKKGVMQQLFSGKLRFKDENGKEFPEWEEKKLGELVTIRSGSSPSLFALNPIGDIPFYKVEELNNCTKYQYESRFYASGDVKPKEVIESGSVIFPKRGAAILNNKVRLAKVRFLLDTNLMALVPKRDRLCEEFLYYQLLVLELYRIADCSTIPQINNKHIEPYQLLIPSFKEQQRISQFIAQIDKTIDSVASLLSKTQFFKKGLLQQMFV